MSAQGLKPPAASEVSREDGELPVLVTQHVDFLSESAALGPAAHAEGPRGRCSPSHSVGLGCSPGAGAQGAPPRRLPWPPDSPPFVLTSALPPQAPLHAHAPRLRMAVRVAGVCLSHSRRDPVGWEQNARAQSQPYRDVPQALTRRPQPVCSSAEREERVGGYPRSLRPQWPAVPRPPLRIASSATEASNIPVRLALVHLVQFRAFETSPRVCATQGGRVNIKLV